MTVRVWPVSFAGPAESLAVRRCRKVSVPSSATVVESSTAVGASLTSVTVTSTVPLVLERIGGAVGRAVVADRVVEAGRAVVVGVGVYVIVPATSETEPCVALPTAVTVSVWPLSLAGPARVVGRQVARREGGVPSSATVFESSLAVGASLTSVTVTLT